MGGLVLGILFIIGIGSRTKGKIKVDLINQKGEIEWKVRQSEPLDTISTVDPTDSTTFNGAIDFCKKGRAILNNGGNVDEADSYFAQALALDENYWEAKANIAGIHVIKGNLNKAYELANDVRDYAIATNNNLAFSNASLIMASAMETNIDPQTPLDKKKSEYEKIVAILEEALNRSPYDVVVRSAKIKAQIIGGFAREDIVKEISHSIQHEKFLEEFVTVLNSDEETKNRFLEECSDIARLIFPSEQQRSSS